MADEIAQVVELECKGVYYLIKGTKDMIALMMKGANALTEWNHQRYLDRPGSSSWQKMLEVSDGIPPILEFPKEMFEENVIIGMGKDGTPKYTSAFHQYCEEHDLRYCVMPDLRPGDRYVPVAVVAQDVGIHREHIKAYTDKKTEESLSRDSEYDKLIADCRERLSKATTDEEREKIQGELDALLKAKEQNLSLIDEMRDKAEKGFEISFSDYMEKAKDTSFMTDPSRMLAEASTCGVVTEALPTELMMPVRDQGLVPESGVSYYSQRDGKDGLFTIKREFRADENGVVYSVYIVTNKNEPGKELVFIDRDISDLKWQEELPKILKEAGMYADAPTTRMDSEETQIAYARGIETNFNVPLLEGEVETVTEDVIMHKASSVETEQYIRSVMMERRIDGRVERVSIPAIETDIKNVMRAPGMRTSVRTDEGVIEGISIVSADEKTAVIAFDPKEVYDFVTPDGAKEKILGSDAIIEIAKTNEHAKGAADVISDVHKATRK